MNGVVGLAGVVRTARVGAADRAERIAAAGAPRAAAAERRKGPARKAAAALLLVFTAVAATALAGVPLAAGRAAAQTSGQAAGRAPSQAAGPPPGARLSPLPPSAPYGYDTPVEAGSPWPTFRHDRRNTGRSTIPAHYSGDRPWAFKTGKGVFSTPVIGADGTIYVGSADHNFYAIRPDGTEKWHITTGEIIDSAAAIGAYDPALGSAPVTFPSGDGKLYHIRTDDGVTDPAARILWTFDAAAHNPGGAYNNWFEGNVVLGFDGTIYAGNTNFNYYALTPDGKLKWAYRTASNNWSAAAIDDQGNLYWGSCDTYIHAVSPDGTKRWTKRTLGFVAASAAIGSDGTIYIPSFDSALYALTPDGRVRWKFKTQEHIYASVALGADAQGRTNRIYLASADGRLYALDPDGRELWAYDTGDTIRSSPVVGPAPAGENRDIIYFGCGNGKLYAINSDTGRRRWSFDTTPDDPELADRNDLNGSPALGLTGVYIGGEHGYVWYLPYDYPLSPAAKGDKRCETDPGEELPADVTTLYYVTPGGSLKPTVPSELSPSTIITLRLVVRERGRTVNARLWNNPLPTPRRALRVAISPEVPLKWETSADGRYLYIVPQDFLAPGTEYTLTVSGYYFTGGLRLGNLTLGGFLPSGAFERSFTFRAAQAAVAVGPALLPLKVDSERTAAVELTRLSVPLPPMMPSLNQIGFDGAHWLLGTVEVAPPDAGGRGRLVLWAVGAVKDPDGRLRIDPKREYLFPLGGGYLGRAFDLQSRSFSMAVTGIPIPLELFELRGELGPDLAVRPAAGLYAQTRCLSIPTFGKYLVLAGLANRWYQDLVCVGTYVTRPYDGPAGRRPPGLVVRDIQYVAPAGGADGRVTARFDLQPGQSYQAADHAVALLVVDRAGGRPVALDYRDLIQTSVDGSGNVTAVTLTLPRKAKLPPAFRVYVMTDVFPLAEKDFGG